MNAEVLDKAKELLETPDMVLDLYDFTIAWTSPRLEKILGFSKGELVGKQLPNYFNVKPGEKREKSVEHMSKSHGFLTSELKTKNDGTVKFDVEFYTLEIGGGFYHIGKFVKYEIISKKPI